MSYLFLSRVRQEFGGENRELTECQAHTAVAALIPFWWLDLNPPRVLLERTSAEIERAQRRNALTRRCYTKRTRRRLHAHGIKLTEIPSLPVGINSALKAMNYLAVLPFARAWITYRAASLRG